MAIGATMGAAFPTTDLENRVMGETADDVKREAKQVATDKMARAKDAAQNFVEDVVNVPANGAESARGASTQRDQFG